LKRLWEKLDIEDSERERCSAACSGFTPSVILKVSGPHGDKPDTPRMQYFQRTKNFCLKKLITMQVRVVYYYNATVQQANTSNLSCMHVVAMTNHEESRTTKNQDKIYSLFQLKTEVEKLEALKILHVKKFIEGSR
jgi:hypothetical protein